MLVVITVEGGTVQDVSCDGEIDVMLIDLDNIKAGDKFPEGPNFVVSPLDVFSIDQQRKEMDERQEEWNKEEED